MTNWIDHDTFCAYPWMHRLVDTDGGVKVCCYVGRQHGVVENLDHDWNGPYMQDVRRKMVEGERMPMCKNCWIKEDSGKRSARQIQNKLYMQDAKLVAAVERSIDNDFVVDVKPVWIEFRFGNLCNLKCKMCTGHSSSMIVQDSKDLKKLDPERYEMFLPHEDAYADVNYNWYENPEVWAKIDVLIPHIRRLTITGGEPTMIKQNIEFLKRCVALGYAKRIDVNFSTNLTNINAELLELVQQFNTTFITFSLDGTGLPYEYIRVPARWSKVKENMIKMFKVSKGSRVICHVNMVVQLFNVLYLPEMLDELIALHAEHGGERSQYRIQLTSAIFPHMFRIDHAPPLVRAEAKRRLEEWLVSHANDDEPITDYFEVGAFTMLLEQLSSTAPSIPSERILNYCEFIDQNKKAKMQTHLPLLYELLRSHANNGGA